MSRALVHKIIGAALILSGLALLYLKVSSLPEARQYWDAWASPSSGLPWLIGVSLIELVTLLARFFLAYFVYNSKSVGPWVFYPLAFLTALSGLSGIVLVVVVVALRLWPAKAAVEKA